MENLTALRLLQFLQVLQKQTNQENPHPKNLRLYINQAETTGEKKVYKNSEIFFSHANQSSCDWKGNSSAVVILGMSYSEFPPRWALRGLFLDPFPSPPSCAVAVLGAAGELFLS